MIFGREFSLSNLTFHFFIYSFIYSFMYTKTFCKILLSKSILFSHATMNSYLVKGVCEILFLSIVIIHEVTETIVIEQIEMLEYHHKSIDLLYARGESCKIVITDTLTLPRLQNVTTKFETFLVDSSKAFLSTSHHPWLAKVETSKVAMINGCPLARLEYVHQFITSSKKSHTNIVFIDTDTLVLQDLRSLFTRYPNFDVGLTLGGHYVKKKDPNHFINLGVVFIRKNAFAKAAILLGFISHYCTEMKDADREAKILDQYSTFQVLEKYKIEEKGSLLGRKLTGSCISIDPLSQKLPIRVSLLSEEYNTPGLKLYKSSQVAHFAGSRSKIIPIRKYGEVLLQFGVNALLKRYARRTIRKIMETPEIVQECS